MTLAKTDLDIAARYVEHAGAAPSTHRLFDVIRAEYELTVAEVLRITGERRAAGRQPDAASARWRVRDTYLEPLHHLQVALLRALPRRPRRRPPARPGPGAGAAADGQRHRRRDAQHRLSDRRTIPGGQMGIRAPDICDADELVARAEAMRDTLRARQDECEELGRLPDSTAQDYVDAGFFRVLQPRRFGGYEFGLDTFLRITAELSRGCPSSGWVYGLMAGHNLVTALFDEQGQVELFGDGDFRCPLSNLPAPAVKVDGGYVVTGGWDYSSGCDVATHFIGGAVVVAHVERRAGRHPVGRHAPRPVRDHRQLEHARHARHRLAARRRRGPVHPRAPHGAISQPDAAGRRVPRSQRAREPDLPCRPARAAARSPSRRRWRSASRRPRSTSTSRSSRPAISTARHRRCAPT